MRKWTGRRKANFKQRFEMKSQLGFYGRFALALIPCWSIVKFFFIANGALTWDQQRAGSRQRGPRAGCEGVGPQTGPCPGFRVSHAEIVLGRLSIMCIFSLEKPSFLPTCLSMYFIKRKITCLSMYFIKRKII